MGLTRKKVSKRKLLATVGEQVERRAYCERVTEVALEALHEAVPQHALFTLTAAGTGKQVLIQAAWRIIARKRRRECIGWCVLTGALVSIAWAGVMWWTLLLR